MSMDDVLVDQWRTEQLDRMGFESHEVATLVRWGIDLGDVRRLIEAGCPTDLVLRILAPDADTAPIPLVEQAEQYSVKV